MKKEHKQALAKLADRGEWASARGLGIDQTILDALVEKALVAEKPVTLGRGVIPLRRPVVKYRITNQGHKALRSLSNVYNRPGSAS